MRPMSDSRTNGTEAIAALRWQLRKIIEENQGEGSMQVHRDPQTINRAKECLDILDELERHVDAESGGQDE